MKKNIFPLIFLITIQSNACVLFAAKDNPKDLLVKKEASDFPEEVQTNLIDLELESLWESLKSKLTQKKIDLAYATIKDLATTWQFRDQNITHIQRVLDGNVELYNILWRMTLKEQERKDQTIIQVALTIAANQDPSFLDAIRKYAEAYQHEQSKRMDPSTAPST